VEGSLEAVGNELRPPSVCQKGFPGREKSVDIAEKENERQTANVEPTKIAEWKKKFCVFGLDDVCPEGRGSHTTLGTSPARTRANNPQQS